MRLFFTIATIVLTGAIDLDRVYYRCSPTIDKADLPEENPIAPTCKGNANDLTYIELGASNLCLSFAQSLSVTEVYSVLATENLTEIHCSSHRYRMLAADCSSDTNCNDCPGAGQECSCLLYTSPSPRDS